MTATVRCFYPPHFLNVSQVNKNFLICLDKINLEISHSLIPFGIMKKCHLKTIKEKEKSSINTKKQQSMVQNKNDQIGGKKIHYAMHPKPNTMLFCHI